MNIMANVCSSNMGVNEVRVRGFLNYFDALDMVDYKNPLLWVVPQDMMALNAFIL